LIKDFVSIFADIDRIVAFIKLISFEAVVICVGVVVVSDISD